MEARLKRLRKITFLKASQQVSLKQKGTARFCRTQYRTAVTSRFLIFTVKEEPRMYQLGSAVLGTRFSSAEVSFS